jgi:hypothetical protein
MKELKCLFELNSSSEQRLLKFFPSNGREVINRGQIQSYFDLRCGNGMITSLLGEYLGLRRGQIFDGDVFIGQNDQITFI